MDHSRNIRIRVRIAGLKARALNQDPTLRRWTLMQVIYEHVAKEFQLSEHTVHSIWTDPKYGKRCGKVRYDFLGAKFAIAHIANRRKHTKRRETRYYYCKPCKAYHLTSVRREQ